MVIGTAAEHAVLRRRARELKAQGLNDSEISHHLGISRDSARNYAGDVEPTHASAGKPALRAQARMLRDIDGLHNDEIAARLDVSRSAVFSWLGTSGPAPFRDGSRWWYASDYANLTNAERGRIAETAVLFRLTVHRFEVYGSPVGAVRVDWIVRDQDTGALIKLQVKCVGRGSGKAMIPTRRSVGAAKQWASYVADDFDFLIGYDLMLDTAYVYSFVEAEKQTLLAVSDAAAEAWHRLRPTPPAQSACPRS
jgi:transposase